MSKPKGKLWVEYRRLRRMQRLGLICSNDITQTLIREFLIGFGIWPRRMSLPPVPSSPARRERRRKLRGTWSTVAA